MIKHDLHIHTYLSDCAHKEAFISGYIEKAIEAGLKIIGFADHAWDETVEGASPWYRPQTFKRLLTRREEIKNADCGDLKILLGAEGEYANYLLGLGDEGAALVDYIIIPHSHTHMKGFVLPSDCIDNPEKHASYLINSFLSLCKHKKRNLFFGIAHPMSPIGATNEDIEKIYKNITDSMLSECAQAAKEADIAIEVNLSTLKSIPPESKADYCINRFFNACLRAECDFFMGSDAHRVDNLLKYHAEQDRIIALVGLKEEHFKVAEHRISNV